MTDMTTDKLEQRVIEALISFGAEEEAVTREATFEDIDIDSLDLVELGQIVDEEYDVQLKPEDFKGIVTVGDAIDVIQGKLRAG